MRVKLGSDVRMLGDDLTVQHTFALIKAHRLRLEEATRTRQGARVSTQGRAPQDGRTPVLRFRALLTENRVERVELKRA